MKTPRELRQQAAALEEKRQAILAEAGLLVQSAEKENRSFQDGEKAQYDGFVSEARELEERAKRLISAAEEMEKDVITPASIAQGGAPVHIKTPGDNEMRALGAWIKRGDFGGVSHMRDGENSIWLGAEKRASNDTTMNITTAADGGYAVPTGHYNQIIARRDDAMITNRLGVRRIPGVGTTVNVPVDNEADGEFVSTDESNAYDRDAPAITQVAFTLVKYTKKVDLTVELLEDEESRLLPFLEDFVGRGMAKTHNSLLLTEVAANGTSLKTFASATVIAVDELEPIVYNEALGNYLDDSGSAAWVMQRAVHGEIVLLDDANTRRYANNQMGGPGPVLLGFPVVYSAASGATAASTKSAYFGNWNYVGLYEAPGFSLLRDPYTRSSYGEVILNYMFRADYGVLIAEAIGYAVHPSA